jgi:hypothetical protein
MIIAIAITSLCSLLVSAQGKYAEHGEDVYNISLLVDRSDSYTRTGGIIGYSFNSIIDVGVEFSWLRYDNIRTNDGIHRIGGKYNSIQPYIGIHPLKYLDKMPFSAGFRIMYEYGNYSGQNINTKGIIYEVSLYRNISLYHSSNRIIPEIRYKYSSLETDATLLYVENLKSTVLIGASFITGLTSTLNIHITPMFEFRLKEEYTVLGLTIGILRI